MAITFDRVNKYVIPDTDVVTIQDLYNAIQNYQDEPGNLDLNNMVLGAGKDDLGGGVQTGITMTLLDGWTIRWAARGIGLSPEFIVRRVTGGNLAETDGVLPITPSDGNTIVVQASSSATIANQDDLVFGGEVYIDTVDGFSGTTFPVGTESQPSNNLIDALAIADGKNIRRFKVRGPLAWDRIDRAGTEWDGYGGGGDLAFNSSPGGDLANTTWNDVLVSAHADFGMASDVLPTTWRNCQLNGGDNSPQGMTVSNVFGLFSDCGFGWSTIQPVPNRLFSIHNGFSLTPGPDPGLIIDASAGSVLVNIRAFSGGILIENLTSGSISIDFSGKVTLAASCTGGTVRIAGVAEFIDNSTIPNLFIDGLVVGAQLREMWRLQGLDSDNPMTVDLSTGTERRYVGAASPAIIEQDVDRTGDVTVVTRTK